jgi:hypothetical protein
LEPATSSFFLLFTLKLGPVVSTELAAEPVELLRTEFPGIVSLPSSLERKLLSGDMMFGSLGVLVFEGSIVNKDGNGNDTYEYCPRIRLLCRRQISLHSGLSSHLKEDAAEQSYRY